MHGVAFRASQQDGQHFGDLRFLPMALRASNILIRPGANGIVLHFPTWATATLPMPLVVSIASWWSGLTQQATESSSLADRRGSPEGSGPECYVVSTPEAHRHARVFAGGSQRKMQYL